MAITIKSLDDVERECNRFLGRVTVARAILRGELRNHNKSWEQMDREAGRKHHPLREETFSHGCAATGAARRASLDLSRALADFRK